MDEEKELMDNSVISTISSELNDIIKLSAAHRLLIALSHNCHEHVCNLLADSIP